MDEILNERNLEHYIESWTLIPSQGGRFELEVNGELLFSKKALGRHAEPGEVRALVVKALEAIKPDWQTVPESDDD
ncbi:MAG: Rdx family protein [Chloroflexi bacterium]|nr:Rdx family protein [Chloroflexota bacterium]